jgi:ketosteroid isomerase-like protein
MRRARVGSAVLRAVFGLSPRNPLRRAMLRRSTESAIGALNRGDYDLFTSNMSPDITYVMPRRAGGLAWAGTDDAYHGHEGVRRFHTEWDAEWGRITHEPVELLDAGSTVVLLARMNAAGRASGVEMSLEYGVVNEVHRAMVTRAEFFLDWDEAVAAAGIQGRAG